MRSSDFAKVLELGPGPVLTALPCWFQGGPVIRWGVKIVMPMSGLSQVATKKGTALLSRQVKATDVIAVLPL